MKSWEIMLCWPRPEGDGWQGFPFRSYKEGIPTIPVILREIRDAGYGQDTQALRTLTAGLRREIEKNPAKPRYILTEIGVGYRLAEERK
ncbi:MAG: helix-turn-helix domain-containing protein [Aristaeellaceae bacterium]